jgi:hypothetical protein
MDSTLGGSTGRIGGGGRTGSGGGSGSRDSTYTLGAGGASTAAWTRLVSSGVEDELFGVVGAGGGRAGVLFPPQGHFLDVCFLCGRPLASNRDIFMYRFALLAGRLPFICSVRCGGVRWAPGMGIFRRISLRRREGNLARESGVGKVVVGTYFSAFFIFV